MTLHTCCECDFISYTLKSNLPCKECRLYSEEYSKEEPMEDNTMEDIIKAVLIKHNSKEKMTFSPKDYAFWHNKYIEELDEVPTPFEVYELKLEYILSHQDIADTLESHKQWLKR